MTYRKRRLAAKVRQREAVFGQIIQVFRTQEAGKLVVVALAAALLDGAGIIQVDNLFFHCYIIAGHHARAIDTC